MEEDKNKEKASKEKDEDLDKNIIINNKYKIIHRIGEGGFGKVYLVEDIIDKKKYALKVLFPRKNPEKQIRDFKRETIILNMLSKKNNSYVLNMIRELFHIKIK